LLRKLIIEWNHQAFKCHFIIFCMVDEQVKAKEEQKKQENVLEVGEYQIDGPENGDITFDKMTLVATSGAKRIWKVKSMTNKEIIFEIVKFG